MTTKFNKARYAKLKQNKGEEAQSGGVLKRHHLKKGGDPEKSSASPVIPKVFETLLPSLTVSIEEPTPPPHPSKGKDKRKSVSNVWDDPG